MTSFAPNELIVIRHAPADNGGRLCGRRDVAALLPGGVDLAGIGAGLGAAHVACSPALRCRQTAAALFPARAIAADARLWEQDFGANEGRAFADLPDLGDLPLADLATHRAPGGESFADMAARVRPALLTLAAVAQGGGPVVVVAHAGTARAALGLALGRAEMGLAFEIAPLSMTRLRCHAGGIGIVATNAALVAGMARP